MIKVIGKLAGVYTVQMLKEEWETLQRAAGVPQVERQETLEIEVNTIKETVNVLGNLKPVLNTITRIQEEWKGVAVRIQAVLEK